ncbi:MAG: mechanosensitive ion channel family protein [Lachnospiraceae bacterium]|nr:mechanosensitive ion channel family protein [Lachnospiraceae bacterium]
MSEVNNKKRTGRAGRVVGVIIIVLILLLVCFPDLCFFLSAPQKEALKLFTATYLGKYIPMRTESGGFDFMRLVALILMIAGCWAVYRILMWIFGLIRTKSRRGQTLKGILANIIRYAVVVFAIIFGLNILGADVLTVIAGLGILALIIGFGAQNLIEDIFAGFFILFEGRFYVGDIISVDGFRGTVRSIGVVSTQIADVGGNIRIMNNSDIRVLTNLSDVSSVAVSIVSIAYSADLIKAEEVINALLDTLPEKYPEMFPQRPKYMGVENLSESSVDLKVTADVHESNIYNARRVLNRELKLALDAAEIEIPFPQVVVWQGGK